MKKFQIIFLIGLITFFTKSNAQTTVGLRLNDEASFQAYTLFSPLNSNTSYLINNCGEMVHSWACDDVPYYTAYLMDNGNLIRYGGSFDSNAEYIEMRDWDNNILWKWVPPAQYEYLHSDLTIMPGNNSFLLIQEERISALEWSTNGGNPSSIGNTAAFENIIEVEPLGNNDVNVIWEWKLFDHIVQDYDSNQDNFGVLADNPQLLDINFPNSINFQEGWVHFNSVDYNEELDQILISCFSCSEIFIIDHSTSTEEAATSSGGNSGKGGDFLYRYGTPANYDQGTAADRVFFGQHNASWVPNGLPHAGKLLVHDNGNTRPSGAWSRVVLFDPTLLPDGSYEMLANGTFGPQGFDWEWSGDVFGQTYYSPFYSGVNVQPNGNFVIAEGQNGRMFEVTEQGDIVWFYQNPDNGNIANQGSNINNPRIYRAERYFYDYPAFENRDLTPQGIVENTNTVSDACTIHPNFDELPTANFTFEINESTVTFNSDTSSNFQSLIWNFGDGNNSNESNPIYTYTESGLYEVCLYVFNMSYSDTLCQEVEINILNTQNFELSQNLFFHDEVNKMLIFNTNNLDIKNIGIFDLKGQEILRRNIDCSFDLSFLKNGLYLVVVEDVNSIKRSRKIWVQ